MTSSTPSAPTWLVTLCLLACVGLALVTVPTFRVGSYTDDAVYITLAQALASGQGYVDLALSPPRPYLMYPPVFPLLLVPVVSMIGAERLLDVAFLPLQLLSIVLVVCALLCFYLALRRLRDVWAWLATSLVAIHPLIISGTAIMVMSEAPYLLLTMLAFLALASATRASPVGERWLLVAVVAAALASLTRVVGAALLVALAWYLWSGSARYRVAMIALLVTPLAAWMGRTLLLDPGALAGYRHALEPYAASTYLESVLANLADLPMRILPNAIAPILAGPNVAGALSRFNLGFLSDVAGLAITGVVIVGFAQKWRAREAPVRELYVAVYLALLVCASFTSGFGSRYMLPVLPFLVLYFVWGLHAVGDRVLHSRRYPRLPVSLVAVTAAALLALSLARDVQAILDPVRQRIPDISLGTEWLRQNSAKGSLVLAGRSSDVYLYSRRNVQYFAVSDRDVDVLPVSLACSGAEYVLVQPELVAGLPFRWDPYTAGFLMPVLASRTDLFVPRYASPDGLSRVYEVQQLSSAACQGQP